MKKMITVLTTLVLVMVVLVGCTSKNKNESNSSESTNTKTTVSSSTKESSTRNSSQKTKEAKLSKEDIYGKQFKGTKTDPQTEITFTFADTKFDFMDGDVLSYYRNITDPDYQNERTRGMQFENMTIDIDSNNYIVTANSAGTESVYTFKKIDNSTIAWISEGKEIILKEINSPVQNGTSAELTTENLMYDYPDWTIESGITLAEYNQNRKAEANKRLADNGLPADDDFINRNPVIIDRETEKKIHEMVGNHDYMPIDANKVINGVILNE